MAGYSSSDYVAPADANGGAGELTIFLPPKCDLLQLACVFSSFLSST